MDGRPVGYTYCVRCFNNRKHFSVASIIYHCSPFSLSLPPPSVSECSILSLFSHSLCILLSRGSFHLSLPHLSALQKKKKKKPTIMETKQEYPSRIHLAKKKKSLIIIFLCSFHFFIFQDTGLSRAMLLFCLLAICRYLVVMMPNSLINKHLFVFFAKLVCHVWMSSLNVCL